MADYNIYIHSMGGTSNASGSPTTPWQVGSGSGGLGDGSGGEIIGDGFSPSNTIKKGAAFLSNPDSAISAVMHSTAGKLGITAFLISTAIHLTDKAITMYQSFAAPASGDYKFAIDYNNFKQQVHNITHPFSTEIQRQQNLLQMKKETLANEQNRLLLGGTFLNSPYGRYL